MLPHEIIEYDRLKYCCDVCCTIDSCTLDACSVYRRLAQIREEWSHVMDLEEEE